MFQKKRPSIQTTKIKKSSVKKSLENSYRKNVPEETVKQKNCIKMISSRPIMKRLKKRTTFEPFHEAFLNILTGFMTSVLQLNFAMR